LISLMALAFTVSGQADDFRLPESEPIVSFAIPGSWQPSVAKESVEARSGDGFWIRLEITGVDSPSYLEIAKQLALHHLRTNGLEVGELTKQRPGNLNGLDNVSFLFHGKAADGSRSIIITLYLVTKSKGLLLTMWASPDGLEKNIQVMGKIAQSIKRITQ
jgi:hypothetical protein